jgi:hypothetical protein
MLASGGTLVQRPGQVANNDLKEIVEWIQKL